MFRKLLLGVAAAGALAVSSPSHATTALAIVIDGSGSISSTDFATQQTAYQNALTALLPIDGTNAISVYQFASNVVQEFAETIIDFAGEEGRADHRDPRHDANRDEHRDRLSPPPRPNSTASVSVTRRSSTSRPTASTTPAKTPLRLHKMRSTISGSTRSIAWAWAGPPIAASFSARARSRSTPPILPHSKRRLRPSCRRRSACPSRRAWRCSPPR